MIHVSLPMHYYNSRSNGPQHLCLSSFIALRRSPSETPKTPDMADSDNDSGGNIDGSHAQSGELSAREQDRFLPIANVSRIMKKALPANAKISKDAKETVQECVSEFISFVTGEASDKCQREKRKTINGDDLLWAMTTLGFEEYVEPLKVYLQKYRELEGEKITMGGRDKDSAAGGGGGASGGGGGGGGGVSSGSSGGGGGYNGVYGGMVMMGNHHQGHVYGSGGGYQQHHMGMESGGVRVGNSGGSGGGGNGEWSFSCEVTQVNADALRGGFN